MDIVEIQTAVLFGAIFGIFLWSRIAVWVVLLAGRLKRENSPGASLIALLLHSGPFALALLGGATYFALVHRHEPVAIWFLSALWIAPLLLWLLAVTFRGRDSSKSLSVVQDRRGFFRFGYAIAVFIVFPHIWAFGGGILFSVIALLIALGFTRALCWYIWQFAGPELERLAAKDREDRVDKTNTDA